MATPSATWTNRSVLKLARGHNPIAAIEDVARRTALEAIDNGWSGPPFDPLRLAELLGLVVEPRSDIPDARTIPLPDGRLKIEFNPLRPRARVRFSIAHEVVHTLFPDCAARVRNRGVTHGEGVATDDWQLEVLCNVGAAEILMPLGSFADLQDADLTIDTVLELRKRFDVSIEALLIRLVKLTKAPCAAFCASRLPNGRRYHVDYAIPSGAWSAKIRHGFSIPETSVVYEANAIGHTAKGIESWGSGLSVRVECVGLAPYPGSTVPRVVGLAVPTEEVPARPAPITELIGDALEPRGRGPKILAHVVPDSSTSWGGGGFAAALKKKYPDAWREFRVQAHGTRQGIELGRAYKGKLNDDTFVFHMVAQRGIGYSPQPRIRYAALERCFAELKSWATELHASVHMPRIGAGHGGGNWQLIKELIVGEVADESTPTTIYTLPQHQ